jgi:hypothetical protein
VGLFDLLDGGDDKLEYSDLEGYTADSVIESIIREAGQADSGEVVVQSVPQEPEQKDLAPKKSKGKRVVYSVACTLHLSGSDYQVQVLSASSDYDKAYRLNKIGAQKPTGYNVTQIDGEIICECSDFKFRQEGSDSKGCKHIRGLVDMGFFSAPSGSHRMGSSVFDG